MTRGQRRSAIDPAVASLVSNGERRLRRRRLPRAKQAKARRDAARARATYDVPKEIMKRISEIAGEEGISASAVAALLLADGIRRLETGAISLQGVNLKEPSPSPRYDWRVRDEVILDILEGRRSLAVWK